MNELLNIHPEQTMSSREIAELTGKNHQHVLRDIDVLNDNYEKLRMSKIGQMFSVRQLPNGGEAKDRFFELTKIQTLDLMTGYNIELRIKVNRRWEELEKKDQQFQVPTTFKEALLLAAEQQDVIEAQGRLLEAQKPAVTFMNALTGTNTNILMRDMAKLLIQNGVNTGQDRLYDWLVKNKYLICNPRWSNKKQRYENDYMPTQRAAELKIFFVTEQAITVGERSFIKHTVKVTPKGQEYFIRTFLKRLAS